MGKKKIVSFSIVFILLSGLAFGGVIVEVKGMYFQPTDQNFKEVYKGGLSFGGEVIVLSVWEQIDIWAGGHYFTKKGELTFTKEDTTIRILPIYGGIKIRLNRQQALYPYIGGGVGYFFYKEENPIGKVTKGKIGVVGQAGLLFRRGVFVIDLQVSYTYCKVKSGEFKENLGGIHGGVGFGIEF